jgi:hypothetical protein
MRLHLNPARLAAETRAGRVGGEMLRAAAAAVAGQAMVALRAVATGGVRGSETLDGLVGTAPERNALHLCLENCACHMRCKS